MNLQKIILEIGAMETGKIAARFTEQGIVDPFLPAMKQEDMDIHIDQVAKEVMDLDKQYLFMMTPEIALLESLADNIWKGTVIIALPRDIEQESSCRIRTNIPNKVNVQFLNEGEFPEDFIPDNGAVLCSGFTLHGTQHKILPSCYRMMTLYKQFEGQKILVSAFPSLEAECPEFGWMNAEEDFFTERVGV